MLKFKTDRASAVSLTVSLMQLQISLTTILCSTLKQMWKKDSKENGITVHQRKSSEYIVSIDLVPPPPPPAFLQIANRNLVLYNKYINLLLPYSLEEVRGARRPVFWVVIGSNHVRNLTAYDIKKNVRRTC